MDRDAHELARALVPGEEARTAVVGGGWAGIAAAVEATRRGHRVTLFEMAPHLGGRSRAVAHPEASLDNGQHIMIGAYVETLGLMREVGVDPDAAFVRGPLDLRYPDGAGLALRPGAAGPAFAAAVLRQRRWRWRDRLGLLAAAAGWAAGGFRCDASLTVGVLTRGLSSSIREELIDPLCVAALNTPAEEASAAVFLRVLKDALFSAPGSADLLLPRLGLSALLPDPASDWLKARGATLLTGRRVESVQAVGPAWAVDGQVFDRVVLAATPVESARLVSAIAPEWAAQATALRFEPIVTVYLRAENGARLAAPMLALHADAKAPAQFVLDRGQLGGPPGLLAFVISGAGRWVEAGQESVLAATLAQARAALGLDLAPVRTLTEKRATFRCTPGLDRPPMRIAGGLHAAGDYIAGPYPATLEGAVRSGLAAVRASG